MHPRGSGAAYPGHGGISLQDSALKNALSASHALGPAPPQSPTAQPGIDGGVDIVRANQESSTKQKGDKQSEAEGSHLEVVLGEDAHAGGLAVAGAREQGEAGCSASAVLNVRVEDRSDCACVWPGASKTRHAAF